MNIQDFADKLTFNGSDLPEKLNQEAEIGRLVIVFYLNKTMFLRGVISVEVKDTNVSKGVVEMSEDNVRITKMQVTEGEIPSILVTTDTVPREVFKFDVKDEEGNVVSVGVVFKHLIAKNPNPKVKD